MPEQISDEWKRRLLEMARESIQEAVQGKTLKPLTLSEYPDLLRAPGVTFVTLTIDGELRGCIGALEPYQPLVEDVREHAVAAALDDYRFNPVSAAEVPFLHIEISRLTQPKPVQYQTPEELISHLRPGIDGVLIRDGRLRATFLPQVWEKIPDPESFLTQLCLKMGVPGNTWRTRHLSVSVYQVEEFQEEEKHPL